MTLLHNASSFHALPALVSGLHETLGAAAFAGNASRPRFAARSHPLPLTAAETVAKDSVLQVLFKHSWNHHRTICACASALAVVLGIFKLCWQVCMSCLQHACLESDALLLPP